jgi:septal ring factor EnvC (AmiA/AmiB activator)
MNHPAQPAQPERSFPPPVRLDLIAELAGRLDQLDKLLGRLEDAERQAADASEYLMHTRKWQEDTVRTIQEERARSRQHQHALEELADRVRAAVESLAASQRALPREVHELAVELHVLESAGFVTRRGARRPPA